MMILQAHRLGFEPHVLCERSDEPAAQVTSHFHSIQSTRITDFVNSMDYVTFESEFVSTEDLKAFENSHPNKIFPSPSLMQILQNRKTQKELLDRHKIPTSPWVSVKTSFDLKGVSTEFKDQFVLKTSYGGYDGYGTFFCRKKSDLLSLENELKSNHSFIAEKLVNFKRELACILVRNLKDEIISLPLVETRQINGRCDIVLGPVTHAKWKALQNKFVNLMRKENYVGALAIEMFDSGKELLVNELAPRVHNSGHYSQDALSESQFSLHLKAGTGFQLNPVVPTAPAFVSLNLLGQRNEFQFPQKQTGNLHWYGKAENRLGRKMGHLNFIGKATKTLLPLALKERKRFSP